MRLGVLCSGGKDSLYAWYKAMQVEEVACLVTLFPKNPESYMFHTPNLHMVPLQAEAAGLPLVSFTTQGEEGSELRDLTKAVEIAVGNYGIEGIVTGALMSVYQATRIQRICHDMDLWCFNPLWYTDPVQYMDALLASGFRVIISGIFSEPFDESWLGRELDRGAITLLSDYAQRYGITLTGEGGEYETLVLDAPFFKKHIAIRDFEKEYHNFHGIMHITRADLEEK